MTIILDACVSKTHQFQLSKLGYKVINVNKQARDTTTLLYALDHPENHGIIVTVDKNFSTLCTKLNVRNVLLPETLNKDTRYLINQITQIILKDSYV